MRGIDSPVNLMGSIPENCAVIARWDRVENPPLTVAELGRAGMVNWECKLGGKKEIHLDFQWEIRVGDKRHFMGFEDVLNVIMYR